MRRAEVIRALAALPLAALARAPAAQIVAAPDWPDVEVLDQHGRRLRFVSDLVRGRVAVINFIFTSCTAVCPPQTALLREARAQLGADGGAVRFISISVDPRADSPAELLAYAKRFAIDGSQFPQWTFVTGAPREIDRLLAAFDARAGAPQDHPAVVWIGGEAARGWTRLSSLSAPALVAQRTRAAIAAQRSARQ